MDISNRMLFNFGNSSVSDIDDAYINLPMSYSTIPKVFILPLDMNDLCLGQASANKTLTTIQIRITFIDLTSMQYKRWSMDFDYMSIGY